MAGRAGVPGRTCCAGCARSWWRLIAGVVLAVGAALAGGRLGSGPFDPVVVPAGPVLLATFAWIAVPGAVVALLAAPADSPAAGRRPRREPSVAVPDASPEPEDDVVDAGSVEEVPDEVPDEADGADSHNEDADEGSDDEDPPDFFSGPRLTQLSTGTPGSFPGPDDLRGVPLIAVAWVLAQPPTTRAHQAASGPRRPARCAPDQRVGPGWRDRTAPTPTADYARR